MNEAPPRLLALAHPGQTAVKRERPVQRADRAPPVWRIEVRSISPYQPYDPIPYASRGPQVVDFPRHLAFPRAGAL